MNSKINDINDLISEYLKCKDSLVYFCKNYVTMENKLDNLCKRCNNYEHCNGIQYY